MSEQNAPHALIEPCAGLAQERHEPGLGFSDIIMPFSQTLNGLAPVHLDYFDRLIVWLQQRNKRTNGRGNAELLAQRMFALLGTSRAHHLKHATGMTMSEVREHIHSLIDSLPDLKSSELTYGQLWEHRAILDELRPYLKHIKLQPRSAIQALTWRSSVRKSWRWLSKGY
jgi:hypothetical protein